MTGTWSTALPALADEFTSAIHALAARRVKAGKTEKVAVIEADAVPAAASNVVDLTELLKRSLETRKPATAARKNAAKKSARKRAA